ncbi:MAG: TonB-dependent receptor family protein [Flavobacteriaceae bacterium]|uniref:TonB-dependent receptor n=1 Tax=Flavobacterium kayseriense TaxID=2764714 RepID=A0ABR7J997_9FLAO|nr:outer membrane beta-barrel family protein [Flavobacterium kayseriense]MBC5842082.1 TonB-dependent receptor [Flavobacterium kayseriense]MBC5848612.1 TonB-dependent receptor [Flavobacterium kayseriense]MBU0941287.1 TonB-dependent receptor family protein [Bacteroidota bacterium]MBX9887874.1 TonB-dependent receptor family protein [Flavobacteriaceae bacterium]
MQNFLKYLLTLSLFFSFATTFAQDAAPQKERIKITGIVIEKTTKQPLEYATVTFINSKNPKMIAGGITSPKGEFNIDVIPGTYNIKIEFISFKSIDLNQRSLTENTNLGTFSLVEDAAQLNEVIIRAEKSTVEIKLDKKVYNVGQDMLVKGGTVSDVLENVPSVSVDVEGNVSLRGSDNVRIFIDGRPSNALNMAEALRQIPADAIDKVEVITNPSARYDAEGGAGILNIILKKGKNLGLNGTFIASTGYPETYGLSGNLNYKTEKMNYFTTTGYNYRNNQGAGKTNSQYFATDGSTTGFIDETRDTERLRKGISTKTGFEWSITPNTFWTNSVSYRDNNGSTEDIVNFNNFDVNRNFTDSSVRSNIGSTSGNSLEFASNYLKNFDNKGHKLTLDGLYSRDNDDDSSTITGINDTFPDRNTFGGTANISVQKQFQIQADYVLPIGESSQFEAGYKGNFNELTKDFSFPGTTVGSISPDVLQYNEKINAIYTQYGFKVNKLSYLFGLRWEDTNIDINLLNANNFNNKKYNNFFPSAFINYEISDKSGASLSYSKRLSRPRGRFLDPTPNISSNINIFQGNPDLDPSLTDKFDIGYINRWDKVTFNTSMYFENTKNVFSFVRYENGDFVGTTPVILSTPINIGKEQKFGLEFTVNYSPTKNWKINSSFNLFNATTTGDFSYINSNNVEITQNLDNQATNWFTRVNSRLTLPYKVDWQLSGTYSGPSRTAQGRSLGVYGINTSLSKDVLKDKGTIAFNISDIFNSRKMRSEVNLPSVSSSSEMQWRRRQFNLSFTYRINKKKTDRDKNAPTNREEDGGGFPG